VLVSLALALAAMVVSERLAQRVRRQIGQA
jgi:hypothetical protein